MATVSYRERLDWVHPIEPGAYIQANTPAWYNARRGRLTASTRAETINRWRAPEIMCMAREVDRELSDSWKHERITNVAMSWGNDHEAQALAALELDIGHSVREVGLIFDSEFPFVAGTPDGAYVEDNTLVSVQVKCPYNPQNHLKTLYNGGAIKSQYFYQVQWEAMLLRADKIMFVSFDPRQPAATQLVKVPIPVDLDIRKQFRENAARFERIMNNELSLAVATPAGIPHLF